MTIKIQSIKLILTTSGNMSILWICSVYKSGKIIAKIKYATIFTIFSETWVSKLWGEYHPPKKNVPFAWMKNCIAQTLLCSYNFEVNHPMNHIHASKLSSYDTHTILNSCLKNATISIILFFIWQCLYLIKQNSLFFLFSKKKKNALEVDTKKQNKIIAWMFFVLTHTTCRC